MTVGYNATNMPVANFNASLPTYRIIYLCGTYDTTTGLFTLNGGGTAGSTAYYTFVPDNTSNITLSSYFTAGKDYILVGASYSTANYMHLREDNLLFHFDGTNLVPYDTYRVNSLATVAKTGSYDDLTDKPVIPDVNLTEYAKKLDVFDESITIALYDITTANTTITLRNLTGLTKIDWGDGTVTSYSSNDTEYSHTFVNVGRYIVLLYDVTVIGEYAFKIGASESDFTYNDMLLFCKIGNGVTSIDDFAFWYCRGLMDVAIPNSVTGIGLASFGRCINISSVTIPNSVVRIENTAFSGCSGLTSVIIPNSVTNMGSDVFSSCTNLQKVYFEGTKAEWDVMTTGITIGQILQNTTKYYLTDGTNSGGTTVEANPTGQTSVGDLTQLKVGSDTYDIPQPTTVEANPTASATSTLNKLKVGNTTYSIPNGGGGTADGRVYFDSNIPSSGTYIEGDTLIIGTDADNGLYGNVYTYTNSSWSLIFNIKDFMGYNIVLCTAVEYSSDADYPDCIIFRTSQQLSPFKPTVLIVDTSNAAIGAGNAGYYKRMYVESTYNVFNLVPVVTPETTSVSCDNIKYEYLTSSMIALVGMFAPAAIMGSSSSGSVFLVQTINYKSIKENMPYVTNIGNYNSTMDAYLVTDIGYLDYGPTWEVGENRERVFIAMFQNGVGDITLPLVENRHVAVVAGQPNSGMVYGRISLPGSDLLTGGGATIADLKKYAHYVEMGSQVLIIFKGIITSLACDQIKDSDPSFPYSFDVIMFGTATTSSVTSGSTALVTSGGVYTAIENAITTALNNSY